MIDFIIGLAVGAWILLMVMKSWADKILQQELTRIQNSNETLQARVEEINGVFFIYGIEKNEFLAQGSNSLEILQHLKSRNLTYDTVRIVQGEPDVIQRLKTSTSSN